MTQVRYAIAVLWLATRQTYRMDETDGPVPFADFAEFVGSGVSGEPIYYKNWMGQDAPNNCNWSESLSMFACELGDPPTHRPFSQATDRCSTAASSSTAANGSR